MCSVQWCDTGTEGVHFMCSMQWCDTGTEGYTSCAVYSGVILVQRGTLYVQYTVV